MVTHRAEIDHEIGRALTLLKKDSKKILSRDEWTNIFAVTYTAQGKNKNKPIKHLGVRLAFSDPHELFLPHEFQGGKLIPGRMTNIWAGAYTLFGSGWLPDISLDISKGISAPTPWWSSLRDEVVFSTTPFRSEDIFAYDPDSMHDLERHLRIKFGLDATRHHVEPQAWKNAFNSIKDQPGKARDTLLRLALTPISVFNRECFQDDAKTKLISSSIPNFWIGA